MEQLERKIEDTIRNHVFGNCFSKGKFENGRDILYKYYLQYYNRVSNFEVKRLILYNLIWVENYNENMEIVKTYSEQLKQDMDSIENYKHEQTDKYCSMLTYYLDTHKDDLSKDELINLYQFGYDYYKNTDMKLKELNLKFNLHLTKENFTEVLEVIKDIHNNDFDIEYKILLNKMLEAIKKVNLTKYNEAVEMVAYNTKNII